MRLKVLLPTQVLVDQEVGKVVAEAQNGSFGMLPHHIDFAAALVPGVLLYETVDGDELYLGTDEGILVKCGSEVLVSTRSAIPGEDLHTLRQAIQERYLELDERERLARSALARLEAGVVRRFIELRESL
jgi:F-type H+-transporting ATPase subunit epsilon